MNAPPPGPQPGEFRFHNRGRSPAALVTLAAVYGILALLLALIDMAWWIAAGLALFTLPALWEAVTDPQSRLTLDDRGLRWNTRHTAADLPLARIEKARFDTRLDLSVRITFLLRDGRKLRLPHAATPPHRAFEEALKARGIRTERHHFSLTG